MPSSTSSSERALWRRFFWRAVGTAALAAGIIYGFVVLVDPWNILPLSPPFDRAPVTSNQRFSYPSLARSAAFDSAVIGTSTSRLLKPVVLDPEFNVRFVNLAMNDATAWEMSRLLHVFLRAHPAPRVLMLGLDVRWCVTGDDYPKLTPRPFPAWMYQPNLWRGYAEVFNMFAVQEAGKQFGVLTGLKREDMGRDGYTSFVPPDSEYDAPRALEHIMNWGVVAPEGTRAGEPTAWRYPALELLRDDLRQVPDATRTILFFVPYNQHLAPPPDSGGAVVWRECKRRVAALAQGARNAVAVDFMRPSPITDDDTNYWDGLHYRTGVAGRLARDLAAANRDVQSPDYRLLHNSGSQAGRRKD